MPEITEEMLGREDYDSVRGARAKPPKQAEAEVVLDGNVGEVSGTRWVQAYQEETIFNPVMTVAQAMQRWNFFAEVVRTLFHEGVDYGKIPGTDKPTLLLSGAEKLGIIYGLRFTFKLMHKEEDWGGATHDGEPFFQYHYKCTLRRHREVIATGEGSCNSWEDKYRYRWMPAEQIPEKWQGVKLQSKGGKINEFDFAIEKAETTGQWGKPAEYWQKFKEAIENGTATRPAKPRKSAKGRELPSWEMDGTVFAVPNERVFDQVNTITKMAEKRAFMEAIKTATNASQYFTQDQDSQYNDLEQGTIDNKFELRNDNAEVIETHKRALIQDLTVSFVKDEKPLYKDKFEIAATMRFLGLEFSIEQQDEIKRKLIEHAKKEMGG